jgi:hypothetical protein
MEVNEALIRLMTNILAVKMDKSETIRIRLAADTLFGSP